ncbi:MAG: hypothetical protein KKD77_24495 [Gammaproteobacteria bacterium]|nr:hypothetical protein [Gammaproteobacteria bacterium]MBU2249928.1 hypothetical protein [Gammaproteobacteria bacterium]MBU2685584.1 hypothetical protein [Gammaproteobacteria bacterium]
MDSKSNMAWPWTHVDDTVLVQTGGGTLHSVVVNGLTTAGDITLYDGVDNTGDVIAVLHLDPATSISVQPIPFPYDAKVDDGIYVEYDQTAVADLTVMHI